MSKSVLLCAVALLVSCAPARADWRTPITGAKPILPARFVPFGTWSREQTLPPPEAAGDDLPSDDAPIAWIAPLVDRRLSATEKMAPLAAELQDAILRVEPIYDPTRLYGPATPVRMSVSAGTATMDSVFADRWRRADPDANVNRHVAYLAMAWQAGRDLGCDAFSKSRPRAGYEQPALSALTQKDCDVLLRTEARDFDEAPPVPIVIGWIGVPVFAAPMPGARMSSLAFWAERRAEIARVEEELKLRQVWHGGLQGISRSLARR